MGFEKIGECGCRRLEFLERFEEKQEEEGASGSGKRV